MLFFKISKAILKKQSEKKLYKKIIDFEKYIKPKIHKYNADIVIEGHYHQDEILNFEDKIYINLNSFAIEKKIYEAGTENNKFKLFGKNLV